MTGYRKIFFVWFLSFTALLNIEAAEELLTLDACYSMALNNHAAINTELYYQRAFEELQKATFTLYLPKVNVTGAYIHNQKKMRLLSEDMLIPVIPYEAMQDGQLHGESFWMDPANNELLARTFVTEEMGGFHFPVEDATGTYPHSDLTGGYIFKNHAFLPEDMLALNTRDLYILNIGLYQPVYQAGKIRHANQVAAHTVSYQKAKTQLKEFEILQDVEHYYWLTLALQEKISLAEQNKSLFDTLLLDVKRYYEQEMIPYASLLEMRKEHAEALVQLLQAKNNARLAGMVLNQLIGRGINEPVVLSAEISDDFLVMDSVFLSENAITARPELEMLRQQVDVAASGYAMARKRYLPEVGLSSNYYLMNPDIFNGFKNEFGSNWNVGVTLSFPLIDWGERVYTMRAMRYIKMASEESLRNLENAISIEVQQELFRYRELIQEWQVMVLDKELAELRFRDARASYDKGLLRYNELLKIQTTWFEAQSDYIQLFADIRLALVRLNKAGGVAPEVDTN